MAHPRGGRQNGQCGPKCPRLPGRVQQPEPSAAASHWLGAPPSGPGRRWTCSKPTCAAFLAASSKGDRGRADRTALVRPGPSAGMGPFARDLEPGTWALERGEPRVVVDAGEGVWREGRDGRTRVGNIRSTGTGWRASLRRAAVLAPRLGGRRAERGHGAAARRSDKAAIRRRGRNYWAVSASGVAGRRATVR